MKTLLAGLLLLTLSACMPVGSAMEVSWGPSPWYTYCTWDAPCWYSENRVFVYGWGYLERPTYVLLYENPGQRERWEHRRAEWHPRGRPAYRGRDWDEHKHDRDRDRHDNERRDH
jgi:hypothetical protein